jgi:hydrogenase maturation protease
MYPDVFSLFNDLILSFRVNSIKPERKIYEELRNVSGCPFEEIIYVDDRGELIEAARTLNIKSIQYISTEDLIQSLWSHKVCVPEEEDTKDLFRLKESIDGAANPLLVGMGNRLRSDDMIGSCIVESLQNKIRIRTLDVREALENYLHTIQKHNPDVIVFIDSSPDIEGQRMKLALSHDINESYLYHTHNSTLKLAIQYLREVTSVDILVLGIRGYRFDIGEELTEEAQLSRCIVEQFFLKNYATVS